MTKNLPSLTIGLTCSLVVACAAGLPLLAQPEPGLPAADTASTAQPADTIAAPEDGKPQPGDAHSSAASPSRDRSSGSDSTPDAGSDSTGNPAESSAGSPSDITPQQVLKQARDNLIGYRSVSARILQTVTIGDRRFTAEGAYLQGSNLKLKLEYRVRAGALQGKLLEVCDGQVLWTRYDVEDTTRITRRDVRQILKTAATSGGIPENMLIAELGLGGLPALLASLERRIDFTAARSESVDVQGKPFEVDVISGTWKPDYRKRWERGEDKDTELPEHVPDSIDIYFNPQTRFPYRILYRKKVPGRDIQKEMVSVEFHDIEVNVPVDDKSFFFVPPDGIIPDDVTNAYLMQMQGTGQQPGAGGQK